MLGRSKGNGMMGGSKGNCMLGRSKEMLGRSMGIPPGTIGILALSVRMS